MFPLGFSAALIFIAGFFAGREELNERSLELLLELAKTENVIGILSLAVSPQARTFTRNYMKA